MVNGSLGRADVRRAIKMGPARGIEMRKRVEAAFSEGAFDRFTIVVVKMPLIISIISILYRSCAYIERLAPLAAKRSKIPTSCWWPYIQTGRNRAGNPHGG